MNRRSVLKSVGTVAVGVGTLATNASAATRTVTVKNPGELFNNAEATYDLEFDTGYGRYSFNLSDGETHTIDVDRNAKIERFRVESDKYPTVKLTTSGNSGDTTEGRIEVTGQSPNWGQNAGYAAKAVGCIQNDGQPNLETEDSVYDCEIDNAQAQGDEDSYTVGGQLSYLEMDPNQGHVEITRLE